MEVISTLAIHVPPTLAAYRAQPRVSVGRGSALRAQVAMSLIREVKTLEGVLRSGGRCCGTWRHVWGGGVAAAVAFEAFYYRGAEYTPEKVVGVG